MDEGRKRALLIAGEILAARESAQIELKSSPALTACIADPVTMARRTLQHIDR